MKKTDLIERYNFLIAIVAAQSWFAILAGCAGQYCISASYDRYGGEFCYSREKSESNAVATFDRDEKEVLAVDREWIERALEKINELTEKAKDAVGLNTLEKKTPEEKEKTPETGGNFSPPGKIFEKFCKACE